MKVCMRRVWDLKKLETLIQIMYRPPLSFSFLKISKRPARQGHERGQQFVQGQGQQFVQDCTGAIICTGSRGQNLNRVIDFMRKTL